MNYPPECARAAADERGDVESVVKLDLSHFEGFLTPCSELDNEEVKDPSVYFIAVNDLFNCA